MKKKRVEINYLTIKNYIKNFYVPIEEETPPTIRFSLSRPKEDKNSGIATKEDVENFKLDNSELYKNVSDFIVEKQECTFVENLLNLISKTGKKDSRIYKDAGIDRRLFSKIVSNYNYQPSKDTVFAFALSLELNLEQAKKLLSSAGFSISNSSKREVILSFCYENGIYNIKQVNEILYVFRERTF